MLYQARAGIGSPFEAGLQPPNVTLWVHPELPASLHTY